MKGAAGETSDGRFRSWKDNSAILTLSSTTLHSDENKMMMTIIDYYYGDDKILDGGAQIQVASTGTFLVPVKQHHMHPPLIWLN